MSRSALTADSDQLVRLLQLVSPALPVGAYSYSEGLESAVEAGTVTDATMLKEWIEDGLQSGSARLEAAILVRAYAAWAARDRAALVRWNAWLTAARETEELRMQGLDMGRALLKLIVELKPESEVRALLDRPCNFTIAFAVAAAHWGVARDAALIGYLQSWAANLVGSGVKLIPLGQTAGQKLLWDLQETIEKTARRAPTIADDDLGVASMGLALASMAHETQYSRLFRS